MSITAYHAKYYAYELTKRHADNGVDRLSQSLFDASVDLNPHQIEAALFAMRNPLQQGVLLADEVGLGKTIEAALVVCQLWAERRRRILVIAPASLRKQWAQELYEKFAVPTKVVDATVLRQEASGNTLQTLEYLTRSSVVIFSYHFAARLEDELRAIAWDSVVIDEAHKLRNAHRPSNRIGQALRRSLEGRKKLLLTATPLQNSLMELYGLSTLIDEHLFGDDKAFRKQFVNNDANLPELRERIKHFTHRTLRKDVLEYVQYTQRKALTQPFEPTNDEQAVYEAVSAFLQREHSFALPKSQRHLTGLILRKLLASSTPAIVGTLNSIYQRLEKQHEEMQESSHPAQNSPSWWNSLADDEDLESDTLEALEEQAHENGPDVITVDADNPASLKCALEEEMAELGRIIEQANNLNDHTKASALLSALALGFSNMQAYGAPRKAIIFTESRRTQEYLHQFLSANGYAGKLVLFSGTNNHPESLVIYRQWLEEHKSTDRVTGSAQIDKRTALIDHFRERNGGADIMIATEAAAEGVNLQFCALLINYDLPWNPQRVEQRIGRCHRYGQQFDVVVINFLNTRNHADQRVLELLSEKLNLFSGVFGASDEVLGRIESGIDFEKRILTIYDTCRSPEEIEAAFNQLQSELEDVITHRVEETQAQLLENFDEDVHDRLKLRLDEAEARLDKIGRWFWGVTRYALAKHARFDPQAYSFALQDVPADIVDQAPTGRYQLLRGAAQTDMLAHAYRLSHPLGEWALQQARQAATPTASVTFNYQGHDTKLSQVEALVGQSGWLTLQRLAFTAFETTERLLFNGMTDSGTVLDQEVCEKLMAVEAKGTPSATTQPPPASLAENCQRHCQAVTAELLEDNQRLFNEERDKLEKWADDKLLAAEEALKNTKAQIKQHKRDARKATTLQEQNDYQEKIAALERQQRQQRRKVFDVEDEIIDKRDELIDSLKERLQETTETETLFTLRWQVV
mgnify:CR=1 FL=1|jgi:superfamily II DNA/RNA helicase